MECLHAAVCAGADAVYLGLDEFNARRNAGNFTVESLAEACDYAHLRGVSVYVTMNVEILPSELDRALDLVLAAYEAGADAFIVQDIGLASELHATSPNIPVHVSTQMNIHNAAGIAASAQLGATRVTLARELSFSEIAELAALAADFGMEVECFAHGALCVCYSGQCLMSSMIGGRSANRGLCAQACRLPYELHAGGDDRVLPASGEHLLSPKDLCTIDVLDRFRAAGVASLKVEGRMKSAEYVHEVVSVYREVLDSGAPATDGHRARLSEAFSRGFTTAYLDAQRGNDIMSYGRPNNRGVFVGRVSRAEDGFALVVPEVDLHDGDVLEFWTNRGHFAATLPDARVDSGGAVRVPIDQRTGKGDRVFRVRNAATAFHDDPHEPRIPVSGTATLRIGMPAHVSFEANGSYGEALGDVVEPARTRAVQEQDVRDHVDRLGNTPFKLAALDVELDENVGIGFSQLHRLRSEALEALKTAILQSAIADAAAVPDVSATPVAPTGHAEANRSSLRRSSCGTRSLRSLKQSSLTAPPSFVAASESPVGATGVAGISKRSMQVVAFATSPSTARAAKRGGADAVYVPVLNFKRGQAQLAGVRQDSAEQAGYPKQCVMALPTVDHDPVYATADLPGTREADFSFDIWDYVREGKPVFADSLAGALRALEMGARVEVGPHVPVTNAASLRYLAELGASMVWLSPELTLGQIADLAQDSPIDLGLFVSGAQELMITEHCLLMSQGPCAEACETCPRRSEAHKLVDRKGFEFPVVTDALGRSHLYNGIELDIVASLPDLRDIAISKVMVDTTLMGKKQAESAVARAVRARDLAMNEGRSVGKRPGTTTGHLFRGVS